jgi:hypothetical protein
LTFFEEVFLYGVVGVDLGVGEGLGVEGTPFGTEGGVEVCFDFGVVGPVVDDVPETLYEFVDEGLRLFLVLHPTHLVVPLH